MTYPANSASVVDPAKLDKLAEVAVRVGLQLQKGQDLVMTAPIAALPLARLITKHAYKAGAGLVSQPGSAGRDVASLVAGRDTCGATGPLRQRFTGPCPSSAISSTASGPIARASSMLPWKSAATSAARVPER